MQESYKMNYVLLPVPAEVLDELELDEFSSVQYCPAYRVPERLVPQL